MFIGVSFTDKNPVAGPGSAGTDIVGVFQRILNLKYLHFGVALQNVAMPCVLVKYDLPGGDLLGTRLNDQQWDRARCHRSSCERMHQPVKHQMRNRPHVLAILELPEILRKVLRADVNVRAVNAPLQHRPKAFQMVHSRASRADIFTNRMVHFLVTVAALA